MSEFVRPEATIHTLKTWPRYFEDCVNGIKTFEVRKNDRDYEAGDVLFLVEWIPETKEWTGRTAMFVVTYLLRGGQFGISDDYCVMAIQPLVPS